MNVPAILVRMEPHATMKSIITHVNVLLVMRVSTVRQTQMNVPVALVRMELHVLTTSMDMNVHVQQDMQVCIVCSYFQGYLFWGHQYVDLWSFDASIIKDGVW